MFKLTIQIGLASLLSTLPPPYAWNYQSADGYTQLNIGTKLYTSGSFSGRYANGYFADYAGTIGCRGRFGLIRKSAQELEATWLIDGTVPGYDKCPYAGQQVKVSLFSNNAQLAKD